MNTNLRTAPHYFVIDSIGGMYEGYSETTCRRVEDVAAPELAKAMVEEYMDQWMHGMVEHYTHQAEEQQVPLQDVKFKHEECKHGGWHRVSVDLGDADYDEFASCCTLFIQVYDGVMLGDGVVVYDQMDDVVRTITHKSTAIRMAEESISIDVERIKAKMYDPTNLGGWDRHYTDKIVYAYDCLADVVRSLEWPEPVMVDIDDTCTYYFPVQKVKRLMYDYTNKITTDSFSLA